MTAKNKFYGIKKIPLSLIERYKEPEDLMEHVRKDLIFELAMAMANKLEIKEYQEDDQYVLRISVHAHTTEELSTLLGEAYMKGKREAEETLREAIIKIQREAFL